MPGTSPRGPRWKWRWRGDLPPTPQALFPLYWEEQSPRICKWVWFKTSRPPQSSYGSDTSSTLTTDSKSVIRNQCKRWNLGDLCTNDLKFLAYMCLSFWKMRNRQWVGAEKNLAPAVCFRETGKWKLSKSWSVKTSKRLTQQRENILMLIDVSSLCICYYFHCPRTPLKAKLSSSHNNTGCDNALLCSTNVIFRRGAGCLHSTGELLWGMAKSSSITFSLSCQALTGAGSVGQSSWRWMPCLQLSPRSCSSHIKMAVRGFVRWPTDEFLEMFSKASSCRTSILSYRFTQQPHRLQNELPKLSWSLENAPASFVFSWQSCCTNPCPWVSCFTGPAGKHAAPFDLTLNHPGKS